MKLIKTGAVFLLITALLVSGMPVAFAVSPPAVQTLKPTHMYVYYAGSYYYPDGINAPGRWRTEDVRAKLNGTVNPNGGTCTVYFEYGTTTAYGSEAQAGTVSGADTVVVSAALTGLRAATLYHFRLVAVSDSGIVYGQDLAFIPSCDSAEIYNDNVGAYLVQRWNAQFITSADPTGNIEIVASPGYKEAPYAVFDIMNHNPFAVEVGYRDLNGSYATVLIESFQVQQIFVPKFFFGEFHYSNSLFKQVRTNDQDYLETPLPRNKVEIYSLGNLGDGQAAVYSLNNRNNYAVALEMVVGSTFYPVTVPASAVVYFVAPLAEMAAYYDGEEFMIVEPPKMKWHGAALVTASPLGFDDITATFDLQNNDDTAHSVKLKNAGGITHAYTLAPYEHQTVTIEKSNWDVYIQLSPLPQGNITGWVEDGYVKINSASPGAAVLSPLTVSGAAVFMGAYGGSDSSLYVTGGGAWTAVSDQSWLNVSPAAGNGFSRLTMTASANTSSSSRSAVVTVSDGTTAKTVTVTQTVQGRGNALSFDGAYDAVSILDNDDTITDAVTLEAWVKWEPESSSDIQFICGKGIEQMELHTGGSANSLRFIPTPGVYLDAEGVLPTGVWTYVAAVYQPSSALAKLYINGNEVTLTNNGAQPVTTPLASSSTSFALGTRGNGDYPFKGELDDFWIWNRVLTQNEIRLNMANPVIPSAQTGLVSAYCFNQGYPGGDNAGVTVLVDETGYRSGPLYGFALNGGTSNWVASGAGEGLESHTLTYDGNGATSGSAPTDSLSYVADAEATVKAAGGLAKTGSSFGGWNTQADGGGTTYAAGDALTISASNVTLYARWTANQTTGTISGTVTDGTNPIAGANVSLTVSGSVYSGTAAANGSYSILNVPAGTGYTVTAAKSGYTGGSATNVSVTANTTTPSINITLTAIPPATHTVSVSANPTAGGNVTGGGTYSEGASVTVTATSNSGYAFVNWTEGGTPVSTSAAYTFTLGTSNQTLVANFTEIIPDITKGTISGTVTDGTNPVSGANVSLTVSGSVYSATTLANGSYSILNVPAGTGYTVTAAKSGYNSGSASNVSVTADTTTSGVNFTLTVIPPATHTVSVSANPSAGGSVSGGGTYSEGASVTVTASVYSGYTFTNWTEASVEVSTNAAYTFTMGTADRNLTANFTVNPTYTVIFDSQVGSSVSSINNISSGSIISAPTAPTRAGYTFGGWYKESSCTNAWNFSTDTVTGNITLYARWIYNGGNGGGGGNSGGGGGSSTPISTPEPKPAARVLDSNGNASGSITPKLDSSTGTASVEVDSASLNSAFDMSKADDKGVKTVRIVIPEIDGAKAYETILPASFLTAGDASKTVEIKTDIAAVTVPVNMLNTADAAGAQNVSLTIATGDKSKLDAAVQAQIGDRPIIELNLKVDGKQTAWNNDSAPVTVTVSYMPTAEELANPESIVVWYIDGNGKAVSVPNGHYDLATGTVTFTTTHFSCYAVSYKKVNFKDVAESAWYSKAVGFIAARGITTGTGNGNYSPESKLTRGEFIVMMMRAYGIEPDRNPKDNFADAGSTWYTGYLSTVKRLDISGGVGNNMFEPGKEITRQEMFTLLYNALRVIGSLPKGTYGKALSDFSDANEIASWAKDAMTLMVGTGTISGNGGKLSPASTTTRAEIAQVLYNLLSK